MLLQANRPHQEKSDVEAGETTDQRCHQVRERGHDFVALQHRVQFHDQRGQCRKAAAEPDREKQAVLIRNNTGLIEPRCTCDEMCNYAQDEATQEICTQGPLGECDIPLQHHIESEARHRPQRTADRNK